MKYIIMCGGIKDKLAKNGIVPQLVKVNGETLVERTIRILRELGVKDINVSTGTDIDCFDFLDVPVLKFDNNYHLVKTGEGTGYWVEAFYYTDEPCCYLCGDTWYSEKSLKTIVNTKCKDFLMFGTQKPFAKGYPKHWEEPLGFKVVDQDMLHKYCEIFKEYEDAGKFNRKGMSWELYRLIEGTDPNEHIMGERFVGIHDFASDIDNDKEVKKLVSIIKKYKIK